VLRTPTKTRRLALLTATFAVAAVLSAAVVTTAAAQEPPADRAATAAGRVHLWLPEPTGPYAVGVRPEYVSDPSRIDNATGRARELPIRVWYPAKKHSHGPSAPYVSPYVQDLLEGFVGAPVGTFDIDTHATTNATARRHLRGIVLVQPGGNSVTAFQTGLIIDLASRGYAVVAVEIPHESDAVEESDGTVIRGGGTYPFDQWRLDAKVVLDDLHRLVPQADSGHRSACSVTPAEAPPPSTPCSTTRASGRESRSTQESSSGGSDKTGRQQLQAKRPSMASTNHSG
jgi:hypothetical protein